jgi:hypothetical protein
MIGLLLGLAGCSEPAVPVGLLMVADSGNGRVVLMDPATQERTGDLCMASFEPTICGSEGASDEARCLIFGVSLAAEADQASATLDLVHAHSYLKGNGYPGGLTRWNLATGELSWQVKLPSFPDDPTCSDEVDEHGYPQHLGCGFNLPHALAHGDGWTAVADTGNDRVLLLAPDAGGVPTQVIGALSGAEIGLPRWPNMVQVVDPDEGLLLVTWKGSHEAEGGGENMGLITLWDVKDPGAPNLLWRYPQDGFLAAVHGAHIFHIEGQDVLVYAHALGRADGFTGGVLGSIGLASLTLPEAPTYLADLHGGDGELGFVRDVELIETPRGAQWLVTDSGCENLEADCALPGEVHIGDFFLPPATGRSGAFTSDHTNQAMVELPDLHAIYTGGLRFPFEADLVPWDAVDGPLLDGPGPCTPTSLQESRQRTER